jgi:hypothetical protein
MIDSKNKTIATLFDFFKTANDTDEFIFIKDGTAIKTHSYTFIEINPGSESSVTYQDLFTHQTSKISISNHLIPPIGIN